MQFSKKWLNEFVDKNLNEIKLSESIELAVRYFGGIDMAVLNAGIFPQAQKVSELSLKEWKTCGLSNTQKNTLVENRR